MSRVLGHGGDISPRHTCAIPPLAASRSDAAERRVPSRYHAHGMRWAAALAGVALMLVLMLPAGAHAAVSTFGSDLTPTANLETVDSLKPDPHFGADTALWNTTASDPSAASPAPGQIVSVRVKGCAQAAAGATTTTTEVHFQDLVPQADGTYKVNVTSQAFNLPICGQGADQNTITTFQPTNLCVNKGDYVDFNDNGGFDPAFYPNGVPLFVMASRTGSSMDSFIRHNGTGNGATFAPSDTTANDGFAQEPNQELLLQASLATGPDATPLCPGGTAGTPAVAGVTPPDPPSAVTTNSATFSAVVNPHGAPTTAHFVYAADLGFGFIAQAFSTYTQATPDVTVGSDFADHTVTATVNGLLPNATYHWAVVVTNHLGTYTSPDLSFKTLSDAPPPPPVLGQTEDASVVSGVVLVKLPPGAHMARDGSIASVPKHVKGQGFVPLTEARSIPVGSILDTTAGTARLTAATSSKAHNYTGDFTAGIFQLLQNRKQKGLSQLNIMNTVNRHRACASLGKGARASAAKKVSSKVLGLLKSSVRGHFATRGDYSSATVRGTVWSVTNTCAGTLTRVTRGSVVVRDFRRHKNILVGRGHSYFASALVTVGKP